MRLRLHYFFFLVCLWAFSACAADEGLLDDDESVAAWQNQVEKEMKVLVIGNSLSRDAFSYVPGVINNLCPKVVVDICVIYVGGSALSAHYARLKGGELITIDRYDSRKKRWTSISGLGDDAIRNTDWDLIVFQEGSTVGRDYAKTLANITQLKDFISGMHPEVKSAVMLIPGKLEGETSQLLATSESVWRMFSSVDEQLVANHIVDFIVPCGTAMQNARRTSLDVMGDFGHLSYDGSHAQEGIPCLLQAYAAAETLFAFFGIDATVADCRLQVTQDWVNKMHVFGQHGSVIKGTADDYAVAKYCALQAVAHPLEISEE